jgi:hypothetical protein
MTTTETSTKTIFTFKGRVHTFYVDFTEGHEYPYQVCEDEISRAVRKTLGEALEYIMLRIGQSDWKIQ